MQGMHEMRTCTAGASQSNARPGSSACSEPVQLVTGCAAVSRRLQATLSGSQALSGVTF